MPLPHDPTGKSTTSIQHLTVEIFIQTAGEICINSVISPVDRLMTEWRDPMTALFFFFVSLRHSSQSSGLRTAVLKGMSRMLRIRSVRLFQVLQYDLLSLRGNYFLQVVVGPSHDMTGRLQYFPGSRG